MSDRTIFPVGHQDARFKNKVPIIGVKLSKIARAYRIEDIRGAKDGIVRDTIGEGEDAAEIELRVDPKTGAIQVVKLPDKAQVIHTFWFAWVAYYPKTQVYEIKN